MEDVLKSTTTEPIEDRITELISSGAHGLDVEPYFLAVAAAYGGLEDLDEAYESVHENEDFKLINDKLYEYIYDTLTQGDKPTEQQVELMSEAFDDGLESIIVPMHYPL